MNKKMSNVLIGQIHVFILVYYFQIDAEPMWYLIFFLESFNL